MHNNDSNKKNNNEDFKARTNHLDKHKEFKIYKLIKKYENLFAKNKYDIGTVSEHMAHIKLIENKFISKKLYKCSFEDNKITEEQVSA